MIRRLMLRLFYWLGRRLGKLPTVVDCLDFEHADPYTYATVAIDKSGTRGIPRTLEIAMFIVTVDLVPVNHPIVPHIMALRRFPRLSECLTRTPAAPDADTKEHPMAKSKSVKGKAAKPSPAKSKSPAKKSGRGR